MSRKKSEAVEVKHETPWTCAHCWYYAPHDAAIGHCMGLPPQPVVDDEGNIFGTDVPTLPDRKGCHYWRARHNA